MSLINDVLKDLEKRQGPTPATAPGPVTRRRSSSTRRVWQWPLWLLAAVSVGLVLHLSLDGQPPPTLSAETAPLTAQADARSGAVAPASDRIQPGQAPEPRPTQARETAATLTQATAQESIGPEALAQADSRPQDSPDRPSAPVREATPRDTAESSPPEQGQRSGPDLEASTTQPPADAESVLAETREQESTISIRRSDSNIEQTDPLAASKRLLARGQVQRAESRLRQLVSEQPELTEAHELLARTLVQRRQSGAAIRVLENGLSSAQDPVPLAALLGRLLIERGEVASARAVLDQNAPALSEAPDYHLLLAAAHRQAGDHEQAAQHYRQLAQELPRRGAVWIGLGASLESLGQPTEAVKAYNRALDADDTGAARFARERLAALEPITGEPQ